MDLDDELCLCFHVSQRKVQNFLRVEKPSRPGQLSECFGAGTGCGWCRPFLERLFDQAVARGETQRDPHSPTNLAEGRASEELTAEDYADQRSAYVRSGGGVPPPGATPINE